MSTTPQQPERAEKDGQHTPGPWTIGGRNNSIVFDEKGHAVSNTLFIPGRTDEEKRRANARLIVQAPAMLELLKFIMAGLVDGSIKSKPIITGMEDQDATEYRIASLQTLVEQAIASATSP